MMKWWVKCQPPSWVLKEAPLQIAVYWNLKYNCSPSSKSKNYFFWHNKKAWSQLNWNWRYRTNWYFHLKDVFTVCNIKQWKLSFNQELKAHYYNSSRTVNRGKVKYQIKKSGHIVSFFFIFTSKYQYVLHTTVLLIITILEFIANIAIAVSAAVDVLYLCYSWNILYFSQVKQSKTNS